MKDWIRATKSFRCAACGKGDWCLYFPKINSWCCMRVQSSRPTKMKCEGWWHSPDAKPKFIPKPEPEVPQIDATALMNDFRSNTTPQMLDRLSTMLGVSTDSLIRTGCAYAAPHRAWAWPMVDGGGNAVGIRLRADSGAKWAIPGSRSGLFVPGSMPNRCRSAYIVEGITDVCAALTLGLDAIGRPSCRGSVAHTQVTINRLRIQRAILVSDNDAPGVDGAKALAVELQIPCAAMLLPAKDMRQFLAYGGSRVLLSSLENQLVWRQP